MFYVSATIDQCKMATTTRTESSVTGVPDTGPPGLWQTRYFQVLLVFLGLTLAYTVRICMSVAIVAMTDSSVNPAFEDYDWDSMVTGYILSSFYWGYAVTQIPGGYVAKCWSAKKLFAIGVFSCSIFNLLTPLAAQYGGWPLVCACRVGMGLCQGCVMPCIHTLLAAWVPPSERARLGTFAYTGAQFGTMVSNLVSGVLAESAVGWPSIFYIFGVASMLWAVMFFFIGADSPSTHSRITADERSYIESSLGKMQDDKTEQEGMKPTPWKAILTSVPVWALVAAHCGQNWGFSTIITEISIYMSAILGFNLSENGLMAALPYSTLLVLAFPVSWLSDYALRKGVRRVVLRKTANTLSQWGPALALVGLCFTQPGDTTLSVVIFVIAVGVKVGSLCGFQINHIDLSPNYAGILMSITNFFASIVAIIAPLVVSVIVTDQKNFSQWQIVFYLSAGIYFVSNSIFLLFGSTDRQWWDDPKADVEAKKNSHIIVKATVVVP